MTSVSPRFGLEQGGRLITIKGSAFNAAGAGVTTVRFGPNAATNVAVLDASTIQCTLPAANSVGPFVDVTVSNSLGTAALPRAFTYAVALLEEDFSSATLNPALQDASNGFKIENGVILSKFSSDSDRAYVRTIATDYIAKDFVYELTLNTAGGNILFAGLGEGVKDPTFSNEPANCLYYRVHPFGYSISQVDIMAHPTGSFAFTDGGSSAGFLTANGAQRIRVEKIANELEATLDRGWNGVGPYAEDLGYTFTDLAGKASYVTSANGRIFFGGANAAASFDDLVIATLRTAGPGDPYIARGRACALLSWNPVAGATSYTVYRSTSPGITPTKPGVVVTASATSPHLISGLTPGTTYHFAVTATTAAGTTSLSAERSVTPLAAPPASPGLARALPVTFSSINDFRIDPVRWMAYAVDESTNQIIFIDLVTEAEVGRLSLSSGSRMLSLSPSLRWLVAVCDTGASPLGDLYLFDPEARTQTSVRTIATDAFDVEVLDDASAYVPSSTESLLRIYDARTGTDRGTWGTIANKTLVRATADQRRIYGMNLLGTPPEVYAWHVPGGSAQSLSAPDQTRQVTSVNGTGFQLNSDGSKGLTSAGVLHDLALSGGTASISAAVHTFTDVGNARAPAETPGLAYGIEQTTGELIVYDLVNKTSQRSPGYDPSLHGAPRGAELGPGKRLYVMTAAQKIVVAPLP